MTTAFLSPPTGLPSILTIRKFKLSTPAWRRQTGRPRRCARVSIGAYPGRGVFDIEALSDHTSPLPHMMPRPESFAVAMRELGVDQDKHLIVYDEGNLFSAPRAWWMLRTFGVENVSILGGGLAGWQRDDLPLQEGNVELPEGDFDAAFTPEAVVRVTDVLLASHEKSAQIVDARPAARFNAEADEPRPGLRRGHVHGALNVPWTELVQDGELKTTDELDAIFFRHGVSFDRPIIASCGSGVTAAVVVLALATLGCQTSRCMTARGANGEPVRIYRLNRRKLNKF